jgi:tetratricopeptide (TPR) repeat protein
MARPVGRPERLWRWCWRHPGVAALIALIGILVVGWAVTSTILYGQAATNERVALANAKRAGENEVLAQRNAETARLNANAAQANAALAKRREDAATNTAHDALTEVTRIGEQVLRRIQTKHDPARAEAEWFRLREDLMELLTKELVPMAERIQKQQGTSFVVAASHQMLGDLLRKFGEAKAARRQYEHGFDSVERIVDEQPNNDQARANLGVILMLLGDCFLELEGDAAQARESYRRAWDIQDEIARRPRSGHFTVFDNHRMLSRLELKLGISELNLGHPGVAREWFARALENRISWTKAQPRNVSARSYLSETELWMGIAVAHVGDWPVAQGHFQKAAAICDDLSRQFPQSFSFRGDVATVYGDYGESLSRIGKVDDAEKACRRSLNEVKAVVAHNPDDAGQRALLATAHERMAAIARARGKLADAQSAYRDALEVRSELARIEPGSLPRQADLALARAHCGKRDEAVQQAEQLAREAANLAAVSLPLAKCFAACVASDSDPVVRGRDLARMLELLGAAIRNSYADSYAISTDPDLSAFNSEQAFKALLEKLGSSSK